MNAYPNGTRVFFWTSAGEIKYGTVQSTSRLADGTQVVVVASDGGEGHRHDPISGPADVMQTPEGQFTSSVSCSAAICRWREEGAPKICGAVISCEGVPVHFKATHAIKDMGTSEPFTCRWDGCCVSGKRKNFARHIRERHLNHSRDKGHSS